MDDAERRDLLKRVGAAAFGVEWPHAIAQALGPLHPVPREALSTRIVHQWSSGGRPVPGWVPQALMAVLQQALELRRSEMTALSTLVTELQGRLADLPDEALRRTRRSKTECC